MLSADGEEIVPGYATDVITDLSLDWLSGRTPNSRSVSSSTTRPRTGRGSPT